MGGSISSSVTMIWTAFGSSQTVLGRVSDFVDKSLPLASSRVCHFALSTANVKHPQLSYPRPKPNGRDRNGLGPRGRVTRALACFVSPRDREGGPVFPSHSLVKKKMKQAAPVRAPPVFASNVLITDQGAVGRSFSRGTVALVGGREPGGSGCVPGGSKPTSMILNTYSFFHRLVEPIFVGCCIRPSSIAR